MYSLGTMFFLVSFAHQLLINFLKLKFQFQVARSNGNCLTSGSPKCPLNFEGTRQYQIEVESADDRTPSFNITRVFNITVTNRNDPPYDIRISKNTVKENDPHGTVVGQLFASDEDAGHAGSMRFALVNDDVGKFALTSNGSVIKSKDIDYETDKSHVIEVRATDNGSPPASVSHHFQFFCFSFQLFFKCFSLLCCRFKWKN